MKKRKKEDLTAAATVQDLHHQDNASASLSDKRDARKLIRN